VPERAREEYRQADEIRGALSNSNQVSAAGKLKRIELAASKSTRE
jgi:hypothetical protein